MAKATTKPKRPETKVSSKFKREVDFKINERATAIKQTRIVEALTEKLEQLALAEPYRAKAKQLTEEVERLRGECKAGTEKREVYCIKIYDFKHQEVKVQRVDTREIIEKTTMTEEDRQEYLPLPEGGKPDGKNDQKGEPAKTPGEAMRQARAETDGDGSDEEPPGSPN